MGSFYRTWFEVQNCRLRHLQPIVILKPKVKLMKNAISQAKSNIPAITNNTGRYVGASQYVSPVCPLIATGRLVFLYLYVARYTGARIYLNLTL